MGSILIELTAMGNLGVARRPVQDPRWNMSFLREWSGTAAQQGVEDKPRRKSNDPIEKRLLGRTIGQ
eukprot:102168-Pyramimonas_sp.AAC.1